MVAGRRAGLGWTSIDGETLLAELESKGTLKDILPNIAAVYIWRLRLRPSVNVHDKAGLVQHIRRVAQLPQGRVTDLDMSRSLRLEAMVFGGTGLPEAKIQTLEHMIGSASGARFIWDFLSDLESRIPALYAGESGRLPSRIADHIRGKTGFGYAVGREPVLGWSDLVCEFVRTGEANDDESSNRKALEYLTTILTISNYTQRAG